MSAICTTVKYPHQFTVWIKYHLNIGIDKIYVFIDDPKDQNTIEICHQFYPRVTTIICDSLLIGKQKDLFPNNQHFQTYKEVMSRQILNAKYAILLAQQENINWIFHIDADELLFVKDDQSLSSVLSNMFSYKNLYLRLQNYEIAPEHDHYQNCFTEGVYFKTDGFNYVAYVNGKSGVFIGNGYNIDVDGVHTFKTPWSHTLCSDIVVLHYVSCNFEEFFKKYKVLGSFGDNWFGSVPISITFHKNSRDVVAKCNKSKEECERDAMIFFNNNHVYNPSTTPQLIKIDKVRTILGE